MGLGLGVLLGLGRGVPSAIDTYSKFRAFNAAQQQQQFERDLQQSQLDERKRERDQAFQLDQRKLNAEVTAAGNKQREEREGEDAQQALLQGIATTDRGPIGDALRAAAMAGGGQQAFRNISARDLATLGQFTSHETPEERSDRELRNIIAREKAQRDYSEVPLRAALGAATGHETPQQRAAQDDVRQANVAARNADNAFRSTMRHRPSQNHFVDPLYKQADTTAFKTALDAWRADSADAAETRETAHATQAEAQRVRDELFGRAPTQPQAPAVTPQKTPVDTTAAKAEFDNAAARYKRLLDAGADPKEAQAAYNATVTLIARKYGMQR